ncbi:MAG TPA: hypothetical protein VM802_25355 [Chitinophaga sp.]|uniref:hypothetical protein n=1 Tax=Chitinophaga sp. TaxID=1869181 RepID=UPI002C314A2A|nr:hypothetical protein [Chitinophaga sp.]HVI48220.1 hypothetical protein [Chitinophaga sp.]
MDNKKKSLLSGSLIAGALLATASLNSSAHELFRFQNLGSGETVRTQLLAHNSSASALELKCGEKGKSDSAMAKKGKDGKCGEGKCGGGKKGMKKDSTKGKHAGKPAN